MTRKIAQASSFPSFNFVSSISTAGAHRYRSTHPDQMEQSSYKPRNCRNINALCSTDRTLFPARQINKSLWPAELIKAHFLTAHALQSAFVSITKGDDWPWYFLLQDPSLVAADGKHYQNLLKVIIQESKAETWQMETACPPQTRVNAIWTGITFKLIKRSSIALIRLFKIRIPCANWQSHSPGSCQALCRRQRGWDVP